jgi:succinate dehydrogenase / fumarate reductase cytochrome b subunit
MSWLTHTLSSSIGKKVIMSLTGLFLISFLVIHLSGNLLLLKSDGGQAFNEYTVFMTTNPVIKTISYLLYASILIHIIYSLILSVNNRDARPTRYAQYKGEANSSWSSRNMGLLGTIVLIFLVIHLKSYWYGLKVGAVPIITYPEFGEASDLYTVVKTSFSQWWYVALYVISMIGLAYHLAHGFASAFQTLGLHHMKYTPFIKKVGMAFAIIVPLLFALIPIIMFMNSL